MATNEHAPLGGKLVTGPFLVLFVVFFAAVIVLTQRFAFGLGSVTHLSDGYPWGIWIAIDLIIGTALGCGGLVMALMVYIINKGEYHPLARAGLMTSLFGYTLGAFAVLIDLGRYWQGHNILLPWLWNPNSVLLETALCIFAYILVLMVEFSPAAFERLGMKEARRRVHRVLFVFTGLGVLLPLMHQSSMGTVLVILGHQVSPLWQSQLLTLHFLVTALTIGFAVVAAESVLSSVAFRRPFETRILSRLAGVMAWVMMAFVVIRYLDVIRVGALPLAFQPGVQALAFWFEFSLGIFAVLFLLPKGNRTNPRFLFLGAMAMLFNGILYRLNAYLIGYDAGPGWSYFPSFGEILVTTGIFALHIMLYLICVKMLPVLHTIRTDRPQAGANAASPAE
ncbi:MAG: Ni/Fe-hydrogenase cytochrome b subunit [Rhodospirillales bacterium]|nr:MAG: Ni/Fe-hydrogenase cytochrome b subunit [Rhodospirillales bacterium]